LRLYKTRFGGPMWNLGLGASVETGFEGQCGNWVWGPVWKLDLGTNVKTWLED